MNLMVSPLWKLPVLPALSPLHLHITCVPFYRFFFTLRFVSFETYTYHTVLCGLISIVWYNYDDLYFGIMLRLRKMVLRPMEGTAVDNVVRVSIT